MLMMKKLAGALILGAAIVATGCGSQAEKPAASSGSGTAAQAAVTQDVQKNAQNPGKMLVAYFSLPDNMVNPMTTSDVDALAQASVLVRNNKQVGISALMAKTIADQAQADLYSIQVTKKYPAEYRKTTEIAKDERNNGTKVELANHLPNADSYDTIVLVLPVWWGDVPMAIETFLQENSFAGKKVYVAGTSGGSGFDNCVESVKRLAPQADVEQGVFLMTGDARNPEQAAAQWAESIKK